LTPTQAVVATCTLAGCGFGLEVVFEGAIPDDYTLAAATPEGETLTVRCLDGVGQYPDNYFPRNRYGVCTPTGVNFLEFAPDLLTITVTWDGQSVTQDFQPVYEVQHPNGPACSPACRVGQVTLALR
jgi:hypothetical protein